MKYVFNFLILVSSLAYAGGVTSGTTPERVFLQCQFADGKLELRTSFAGRVVATLALKEGKPQRFGFSKSAITQPVFELELSDRVLVVEDSLKRNSRNGWGAVVAAFLVNEQQKPIQCLMRDL